MNIDLLTPAEKSLLIDLIDSSEKILLCCHRNPDGDAMGSLLGLAEYLRTCGKVPMAIIPDAYPDFLQWLPGTERVIRYDRHKNFVDEAFADADLVFCLDFNTSSRTDDMAGAIDASPARKVLIDHHLDPQIKTDLCISYPEASSTCELVFRVIWQLGGFDRMTHKTAVPIYCGMMTDTGGFTYNSTRPEIFFIISQLLTKRINKDKIYRNVYNNYSEWRLRLMGHVLYNKMVVMSEYNASYFVLTREDLKNFHYIKGDAEGFVNIPLQIKGMKLSISLREDTEKDNTIWVSLRSVDNFPCNLMAEQYFGGGGHLNAAGGRLNCSVAEAEAIVRKAIEEFKA
ncbi:MAG: DHH family phosphoesterase [Prevotellaceae bacterium]|nr:DHH family phosphoesterase [Prevotellaceae bacterium]